LVDKEKINLLNKNCFTLIELLVVIIIIAILAALAMPGFGTAKERTLDKEAKANLALIQAAEKIYRMEAGVYYPTSGSESNVTNINTNLRVSLPTAGQSWNYLVNTGSTQITATRNVSGGRVWTLTYTGDTPSCSGSLCP